MAVYLLVCDAKTWLIAGLYKKLDENIFLVSGLFSVLCVTNCLHCQYTSETWRACQPWWNHLEFGPLKNRLAKRTAGPRQTIWASDKMRMSQRPVFHVSRLAGKMKASRRQWSHQQHNRLSRRRFSFYPTGNYSIDTDMLMLMALSHKLHQHSYPMQLPMATSCQWIFFWYTDDRDGGTPRRSGPCSLPWTFANLALCVCGTMLLCQLDQTVALSCHFQSYSLCFMQRKRIHYLVIE